VKINHVGVSSCNSRRSIILVLNYLTLVGLTSNLKGQGSKMLHSISKHFLCAPSTVARSSRILKVLMEKKRVVALYKLTSGVEVTSHSTKALQPLYSPSPSLFTPSSSRLYSTSTAAMSQYRLPEDIRPSHYDLTVRTDLESLTFEGVVKIE
jgi:hypothetical protein